MKKTPSAHPPSRLPANVVAAIRAQLPQGFSGMVAVDRGSYDYIKEEDPRIARRRARVRWRKRDGTLPVSFIRIRAE